MSLYSCSLFVSLLVPFLLYASFPYYFVVLSLCDLTAVLTELAFVSLFPFLFFFLIASLFFPYMI